MSEESVHVISRLEDAVLQALWASKVPLATPDIAEAVGAPESSCRKVLVRLVENGRATQHEVSRRRFQYQLTSTGAEYAITVTVRQSKAKVPGPGRDIANLAERNRQRTEEAARGDAEVALAIIRRYGYPWPDSWPGVWLDVAAARADYPDDSWSGLSSRLRKTSRLRMTRDQVARAFERLCEAAAELSLTEQANVTKTRRAA